MAYSLFAHLALQFGSQPENLATEALAFILANSKSAREATLEVSRLTGAGAAADLLFASQVSGDDDARPDLVGRDEHGQEPLLIEVKFWAGLTDNQPITYLRRLPPGGTLLFVAPAARVTLLWGELRRRCDEAKLSFLETPGSTTTFAATVGENTILLVSWRELLQAIRRKLDASGERRTTEDLDQLDGLCERMDSEAFLPIRGEELSAMHYRRVLQFNALVDDVTVLLVHEQKASTKNLRSAAFSGCYGRYMFLDGAGVFLACDIQKWISFASTPLWLTVYGPKWSKGGSAAPHKVLKSFAAAHPGRVFSGRDGFPTVALFLPTGAERELVLKKLVEQVGEIGKAIAGMAADLPPHDTAVPELPDEPADT